MRRLILACGCLALFAAPAAHASAVKKSAPKDTVAKNTAAKSGLTAAQIADRSVKASGGQKAWQAVKTLKLSGELDAGGKADAKLPFELFMRRPHQRRLEITFAGQNAVQVYDGTQGWKLRPFLNRDDVEPFKADELESAASAAELDGPLVDHASKGTRIELVGTETVQGKKNYKLELTLKNGVRRFVWVDAGTFLLTKVTGDTRKLDGRPHAVAIYSRNYRTVDGLKIPFLQETVVEGVKKTHKMVLKAVTVNPPLRDAMFAKPTAAMTRVSSK